MEQTERKFYTVGEMATWISAAPRTIQKAIQSKKLHAYKLETEYRLTKEDVVAWLERNQNYPKEESNLITEENKSCQTN